MSNDTSTFWDKRAKQYDRSMSSHDQQFDQRLTRLKSTLASTDHVLDLGCASGEIALNLSPFVKTIEGIDPSAKMIELATQKAANLNIKNTSFLATDIFDPRLEPESYDAILALNVLHLLRDHQKVLTRVNTLLKPGGKLLVETPCIGESCWWQKGLILAASRLGLVPYIHSYRAEEPQQELTQFGFTILNATYAPQHDHRATISAQKKF